MLLKSAYSKKEDTVKWICSRVGDYGMKSAYWGPFTMVNEVNKDLDRWYKKLWKLKWAYKTNFFLWQLLSNNLPVRARVHAIQGEVDLNCL